MSSPCETSRMESTDRDILKRYNEGQRAFVDLDLEDGDLSGLDLEGISFDRCFLAIDFSYSNLSRAKFTNGNIKKSIFRNAKLTETHFEKVAIESTDFSNATIDKIVFKENYAYGSVVNKEGFLRLLEETERISEG